MRWTFFINFGYCNYGWLRFGKKTRTKNENDKV